jgi:HAD superfamily hydrolase (TIGR01484 family)
MTQKATQPAPIKLISTDFDGTLHSDFGAPRIPPEVIGIIQQLRDAGAKWVINTGRDMAGVIEGLDRANIPERPDALVLVEREIHLLEGGAYRSVAHWNDACTEHHDGVFQQVRADLPRLTSWVESQFTATVYEDAYSPFCLLARNNEDADAIHEYMEEYAREVPGLTVVRNSIYARFSHEGYNKGTSLDEVRKLFNIPVENTFAAGDHLNDLPMLQLRHAHMLAAPANSVDEVKELVLKQGGYVSTKNEGHGVAEALRHFIASEAASK